MRVSRTWSHWLENFAISTTCTIARVLLRQRGFSDMCGTTFATKPLSESMAELDVIVRQQLLPQMWGIPIQPGLGGLLGVAAWWATWPASPVALSEQWADLPWTHASTEDAEKGVYINDTCTN